MSNTLLRFSHDMQVSLLLATIVTTSSVQRVLIMQILHTTTPIILITSCMGVLYKPERITYILMLIKPHQRCHTYIRVYYYHNNDLQYIEKMAFISVFNLSEIDFDTYNIKRCWCRHDVTTTFSMR